MQKIIIKHLSGSKANQSEVFELPFNEITFGRDSTCNVVFDPEKDELVSRLHCKLSVQNETQFLLTDLNSTNGTFVNNIKISSPQELHVGDEVQLGKAGVKFAFDLDPRPKISPKATVMREAIPGATREFRVDTTATEPSDRPGPTHIPTGEVSDTAKPSIGKDTVERIVIKAVTENRKKMINIGAGILSIMVASSGYLVYKNYQGQNQLQEIQVDNQKIKVELDTKTLEQQQNIESIKANQGINSSEIFKKSGNSTVLIEASWKLIHIESGKQIFQKIDCISKEKGCKKLPWYIFINGSVEPFLDLTGDQPIGGSGSGSGFVVDKAGFILTNRHVAASWHTQRRNFELPGVLVVCNDSSCSKSSSILLPNEPSSEYVTSLNSWVPSNAKMLGQKPLRGKLVEGRNDYLDVTFPKTGLRVPAHLVRASDSADVALIKIDVPQPLEPVEMSSSDPVSAGDTITVMGYPGISPDVAVKLNSQDPFNREGQWQQIPEPTVTGGNIGKVIEGSATTLSDSVNGYFSEMGDVYQLTVNATGSGNSGGPVFNDKGHVIGIFTYKKTDQSGTNISFAVPIKHGEEIMGIHKLVQ